MKRYRLRVLTGPYSNRYVGPGIRDSVFPDPSLEKPIPVNVPGSKYALWAQQSGATEFTDVTAAQQELSVLGYPTMVIEVLKADEIPGSLDAVKALLAKLDSQISDKKANDYFLGLAKNWLGDVEHGVAPSSMLNLVEQLLEKAQKAVSEYGPKLHIVG